MFENILVPLDGSHLSERALDPAIRLSQWSGARLILLRVPTYRQVLIPDASGEVILWEEELEDHARLEAIEYLNSLQDRYASLRLDTRIRDGDEAGIIVDMAKEEDADLIVMSTHGYSGITRWVLGSVTERVLRAATCPVLVLRSDEPIRNVLITLDGSELAEDALVPGLAVARGLGAEVCLMRVYHGGSLTEEELVELDWTDSSTRQPLHQSIRNVVADYLANVARRVGQPSEDIDTVVMEGSPASTILDYAAAQPCDLIAMATHGRTGLRRWVYGSITEKVMHSVPCSMLIVRPQVNELKDA